MEVTEQAPITLADFEELVGRSYKLADEIAELERVTLKPMKERLDNLDSQILEHLTKLDMTSFKSKHGTVVRSNRYSVQTPKTIEEKKEFFRWLNEKGPEVYWSYATVNSQSLNALYKAELEVAKEEGNLEFKIPGIGEPTATPILSRRKK
jgi:hypothetical protein